MNLHVPMIVFHTNDSLLVQTMEQGCPLSLPECHAYRLYFYLLFVGFICVFMFML